MLGLGNSITSGSVSSLPFSPEQVSGLVGWYDFTDADTVFQPDGPTHSPITIGKPISKVTNKAYDGLGASSVSLNAFLQQPVSGRRPDWKVGTNGLNCAEFTVNLQSLYSMYSTPTGAASANRMGGFTLDHDNVSMFIVFKTDQSTISTANDQGLVCFVDSSRLTSQISLEAVSDQIEYQSKDGTQRVVSNTAWASPDFEAWSFVNNSTNSRIWNSVGSPVATEAALDDTHNRDMTANSSRIMFLVGARDGANSTLGASADSGTGAIHEVLIYNNAVSDSNLSKIQKYLHDKYGL